MDNQKVGRFLRRSVVSANWEGSWRKAR